MRKSKPALLYLVVNKVNGKRYVGITTRINVMRRMTEHFCHAKAGQNNGHFYRAIRKYGRDSFSVDVIAYFFDIEDAKKAEIQYISENNPEYNSTLGGDGRLGGTMSDQAKEKLKKIHTGNKYRLGKPHSENVKKRLSEAGHKNIEIFKAFQHLGPQSKQKRVRCIETGEEWESIKEAALAKGVARSSVAELCLKRPWRKTAGGLRFEFVEDDNASSR